MARSKPTDRDGLIRRICERVEVDPVSGCMNWAGGANPGGYGVIGLQGRGTMLVSRVVVLLGGVVLTRGRHVLHRCDNPRCVNPAHLWVGSNAENVADRCRKGRTRVAVGERQWCAKLNGDTVRLIRAASGTNAQLAGRFGVSVTAVRKVRARITWRHIHETTGGATD